jgi:hypothetical protein
MAELEKHVFSHREVVEALILKQGLHEGLWALHVEFGIAAGFVGNDPNAPESIFPAAIVPVVKLGLQKADKPSSITADAAEVNPKSKSRKR